MRDRSSHFYFLAGIYLRGLCIGIADLVPGVSGGTIALLTGVYAPLLTAIQSFDKRALRFLWTLQWRALSRHLALPFLIPLLAGAATSVFVFARLIRYLLHEHPIPLWSFFAALLWTSIVPLLVALPWAKKKTWICAIAGAGGAYALTQAATVPWPDTYPGLALAGALAIGATLLPGVSGSFVLVLIDQYERLIEAISRFDIPALSCFAIGMTIGGWLLARQIHRLLKRHYTPTIAFLMGAVVGAMPRLWPWRLTLETGQNITLRPSAYQALTQQNPQIGIAMAAAAAGVALVVLIRYASRRLLNRA